MPGPGWRKCTAYRQAGPGIPPLALRLSKGLASTFGAALSAQLAVLRIAKMSTHYQDPNVTTVLAVDKRVGEALHWMNPT